MSNYYCNCGGIDPADTISRLNDRIEKLEKALEKISHKQASECNFPDCPDFMDLTCAECKAKIAQKALEASDESS